MNKCCLLMREGINQDIMAMSCSVCPGVFEILDTEIFELCFLNMRIGDDWGKTMIETIHNAQKPHVTLRISAEHCGIWKLRFLSGRQRSRLGRNHASLTAWTTVNPLLRCFKPGWAIMETSSSKKGILRKASQFLKLSSVKKFYIM